MLALLVMSSQADFGREIISESATISACEKGAKRQMACVLLTATSLHFLGPNTFSYGSAISACGKVAKWQGAPTLLKVER